MENEFNYEKYAWEFMRRDENFRKVYDEYIRLIREDLFKWRLMVISMHLHELFPGCERLPNPYKPFEEAFKPEERMNFYKYVLSVHEKNEKKYDQVVVTFKIDGTKSINKIKDEVLKEIDSALTNKYVNLKKRNNKDYDTILRVGDYKKKGLSDEQIAKIMPEYSGRTVTNLKHKYRALIKLFRPHIERDEELYRETKARLEYEPDINDVDYWNKEIEKVEKSLPPNMGVRRIGEINQDNKEFVIYIAA